MLINEFRWSVKPAIPGHWHTANLEHDGFEVEIAADRIEARCEDIGQRDTQQKRAGEIVAGIVRKMGLAEQTRFTTTFGSLSRFDPHSGRRNSNVFLSASLSMKAGFHADAVVISANGPVITDSRKKRMSELVRFADDAAKNETLRRLSDYMLDYYADPEKRLAPLYDIIELATKVFGDRGKAISSLGISARHWKKAAAIMNNPTIRSGRHRGQELGKQRDPTPAEVRSSEAVAEQIVSEYGKLVRRGSAPR